MNPNIRMSDPSLFRKYYTDNEQFMDQQWEWFIWPFLKWLDLTTVVDIACGFGRNTRKFIECGASKEIYLLDINPEAIQHCRKRFANISPPPHLSFILAEENDTSMSEIANNSLSLAYTWDSMVHFELDVIEGYMISLIDKLQVGGAAFFHHSNLGALGADDNWLNNPGWRTNVSKEQVAELVSKYSFEMVYQKYENWDHLENSDCITVFKKTEMTLKAAKGTQ